MKNSEKYYPLCEVTDAHRDVALVELEEAQKNASNQTKIYGYLTNALLAVTTFFWSFLVNNNASSQKETITLLVTENSVYLAFASLFLGAFLLRYFVELQRQITYNARKVVTLRTILGLDYSHMHLTLPNDRVEGASNPFKIKFFNGWLSFYSTPFWILTILVNSICIISLKTQLCYTIFTTLIFYAYIFRGGLRDKYETIYLILVKTTAWFIPRFNLTKEFEYILYRAQLSYIELNRLGINYEAIKPILKAIEDRGFDRNCGVSFKSLFRAALSNCYFFRDKGYIRSGGSTITMQLVRTLFIPTNQSKVKRKIFEILLAFWLTKRFKKEEILNMYIASVRYEKGVMGLAEAIKFFWGNKLIKVKIISNEEAFFLVERLSNVSSSTDEKRIDMLTKISSVKFDNYELQKIYNNYKHSIITREKNSVILTAESKINILVFV